jgi:signal transduction histidine kinase
MTTSPSPRVLIIDDEPSICSIVVELLQLENVDATSAVNGREGLAFLDMNPDTDVVLLDINLAQGENGVEVLSKIKERFKYVQVIMFTSMDDLEIGVECMKRGAFDYMTKPFDEEAFLPKLAGALERKRLTRVHDLYLGILVHDLKNPLQCIIGSIEFIGETLPEPVNPAHLKMLSVAESGISQIKTIIGNILGISKFENNTIFLQKETFSVPGEVETVLGNFRGRNLLGAKQVNTVFPHGQELALSNDRHLYAQILTNVVSNALRFTPRDGAILVECRTVKDDLVETIVANTGSFIPENQREIIFDKFSGVHLAKEALKGLNFGLGLTFSRMAVEAMGGRMWVDGDESVPLTSFHFTLLNKPD